MFMQCFCNEIHWFYQDFKSENLCFSNLYSVHAARTLDLVIIDQVLPNEERNTFTTQKAFPSCPNRYNFSIL